MIKYNYKLTRIRKSGDKKTFTPNKDLGREVPNLVRIFGPHSSGKTTLLHIIAIAFYGHKKISLRNRQQLYAKIQNLLSKRHELTFDIQIEDKINGENIIIKKTSKTLDDIEFFIEKDGQKTELNKLKIDNKYEVLIDIPDNPLGRLDKIKDLVKTKQQGLNNKINDVERKLRDFLLEIQSSSDPEEIRKAEKKLSGLTKSGIEKSEELLSAEENLSFFRKFSYSMFYNNYKQYIINIDKEIKKLKTEHKDQKDTKKKREKNITALIKEFQEKSKDIREAKDELVYSLRQLLQNTSKENIEIFQKLDIIEELRLASDNLIVLSEIFIDKINDVLEQINNDETNTAATFLDELIDFMDQHQMGSFKIPGIDYTIEELYDILVDHRKELPDLKERKNLADKTNERLQIICVNMKRCLEIVDKGLKFSEHAKADDADAKEIFIDSYAEEMLKLTTNKRTFTTKVTLYKNKLIKIDIVPDEAQNIFKKLLKQFSVYDGFTEDQFQNQEKEMTSNINDLREENRKLNLLIKQTGNFLESQKEAKPHAYQPYNKKLIALRKEINNLRSIFGSFEHYFNQLMNKNEGHVVPLQKKYNTLIQSFMAKSMEYVMHIGKQIHLHSVDITNGIFYDKKGHDYLFAEFGAGESQAAYLKNQLTLFPNKKIIALFDETGNMDDRIIQEVLDTMRELYKKGNLILGILVQPDSKTRIEDILKN